MITSTNNQKILFKDSVKRNMFFGQVI